MKNKSNNKIFFSINSIKYKYYLGYKTIHKIEQYIYMEIYGTWSDYRTRGTSNLIDIFLNNIGHNLYT